MSKAIDDVLAERNRQQAKLGWTPSHDDEHGAGQLADAGACYALSASGMPRELYENFWPWDGGFKPKDPRNDLVRAAALLIAEVERLDRVLSPSSIIGKAITINKLMMNEKFMIVLRICTSFPLIMTLMAFSAIAVSYIYVNK